MYINELYKLFAFEFSSLTNVLSKVHFNASAVLKRVNATLETFRTRLYVHMIFCNR